MSTASRPSALDRLDVFIGRWLTEGETVATAEAPSVRILASDVYKWGPGSDQFRTYFFDHTGIVITETLTHREATWMWHATQHRCSGTFSDKGRTLTALHEQSQDGEHWAPSMIVTLRRID